MYSYIKGILTDMDEESIVVETGGIGYHIYTTGQTFRYLPSVGEEVKYILICMSGKMPCCFLDF